MEVKCFGLFRLSNLYSFVHIYDILTLYFTIHCMQFGTGLIDRCSQAFRLIIPTDKSKLDVCLENETKDHIDYFSIFSYILHFDVTVLFIYIF